MARPLSTRAASRMLIRSPRRGGRRDLQLGGRPRASADDRLIQWLVQRQALEEPVRTGERRLLPLHCQAIMPDGPRGRCHVRSKPMFAECLAIQVHKRLDFEALLVGEAGREVEKKRGAVSAFFEVRSPSVNTSSRRGAISSRPWVRLFLGRAGSRWRRQF